jgi:hypothetical protein
VFQSRTGGQIKDSKDIYTKAMKLGKSLASLLSDLPIPVVEGHLNLLQQVHDYIKENKRIRLIAGITFYDGKFVPL